MLAKELLGRLLATSTRRVTCQNNLLMASKRFASTSINTVQSNQTTLFDKAVFNYTPMKDTVSTASVSEYISRLRPFSAPAVPQPTMTTPTKVVEELELTSVLRKRRLKMNKHKHKKLRKRTRALRKKLGK